jgi:quercetin dioxygenase-like cupin family protein
VQHWHLEKASLQPRLPEILASRPEARAIVLDLPAGTGLPEHHTHERIWIVVLAGTLEVEGKGSGPISGADGLLVEVEPGEPHALTARTAVRLLMLFTPWPGPGHPGAMTIREKLYARRHAAWRKRGGAPSAS